MYPMYPATRFNSNQNCQHLFFFHILCWAKKEGEKNSHHFTPILVHLKFVNIFLYNHSIIITPTKESMLILSSNTQSLLNASGYLLGWIRIQNHHIAHCFRLLSLNLWQFPPLLVFFAPYHWFIMETELTD